jgi:DNA-binding GntR family transcriptional regulator
MSGTEGDLPDPSKFVSRRSLSDFVYDALLEHVMVGEYPPETALNIDALARDFDVSHTPIREALARLESTGLITRAALRGYRVAPFLSSEELSDLMDARAAIEPANAYFATARASAINLEELSETVRQMRGGARGGSYSKMSSFWFADEAFHRLIAETTDNLFLISAYNTLGGHVQRFRLFAGAGVTDADSAIDEHHAILEAMIAGDKERARLLMADHIGRVKVRVQADRKAFVVREGSLK